MKIVLEHKQICEAIARFARAANPEFETVATLTIQFEGVPSGDGINLRCFVSPTNEPPQQMVDFSAKPKL